jgi:peptidoglycan/xylan/chitin deacetylase (PgdA/CDA1 family)
MSARRLSILMYHRVLPVPEPLRPWDVDARAFDWQIAVLARWFNIVPLRDAVRRLREGTLPRRAVSITFDDGYADNLDVALPILKKHGAQATFFIATGYLDGGRMWNDTIIEAVARARGPRLDLREFGLDDHDIATDELRLAAVKAVLPRVKYQPPEQRVRIAGAIAERVGAELPDNLMLTTSQLRELHGAGMEIGAHTVNHPILASVDAATARREIFESRDRLRDILGGEIATFAYPNGRPNTDYRKEHVGITREAGFELAVSTAWGAAHAGMDRHQLARIAPWDQTPLRFGLRVYRSYFDAPPALL